MNRKNCPKSLPPQLQVLSLSPEEEQELDYNICCCIEEIEKTLSKNPTEKQKKLAEVSLKILKNPGESFIKKKQIMRQWCGDYKKKFEGEKKKLIANLSDCKVNFVSSKVSQKSLYFKKYTLKTQNNGSSNSISCGVANKKPNCEMTESKAFKFNF